MSSASRGLAPREGLDSLLMKMGRTCLLAKPRCGPQAAKSADHAPRMTKNRNLKTRTLCPLAPAWPWSSWLTSLEPREVRLALISLPLVSQPGEAAPEEVLCRPPHEAWPLARVLIPC